MGRYARAMSEPIRKRMRRQEIVGAVRFVTFSCAQRLPLLGHPGIRDLFAESLADARRRSGFELFAWVVMPEHVHLLARSADDAAFGPALRSLKVSVAKAVCARWRRLEAPILDRITRDGRPRFWLPGGGFDRNVRDAEEFSREVRYIHRNPVERGLVERAEEWSWSSVRWWMGLREGEVECDRAPGFGVDWEGWRGFV